MDWNNLPHGDMPGDAPLIQKEFLPAAEDLLAAVRPLLKDGKNVIAISGGSGSGKSTSASLLAALLQDEGHGVYIMSGDNYPHRIPKDNDALREKIYQESGEEGLQNYLGTPQEIDYDQVNAILKAFKEGEPVLSLRRLGKNVEEDWHDDVNVKDTDILILEWTHANSPYVQGADVRVFLDSTPEATLERRIARGRNDNTASPFIAMVLDIEQGKLKKQMEEVQIIVPFNEKPMTKEQWKAAQANAADQKENAASIKPMLNLYPDSLEGNLTGAADFLARPELKDTFSSVYILPSMFHSDLDRGFCVVDYNLEENLAKEEDLQKLKDLGLDLKLDIVLNHLSVQSPQFQDLVKNGKDSRYWDFFINWNEFWKGCGEIGEEGWIIPEEKYTKDMFFRKPGLPVLMVECEDGTKAPYWNTFYQKTWMEEGKRKYLGQMDVNINNPMVWDFYRDTLKKLSDYGASIIRLDAFAYAPKSVGKRNFLNEPDTWDVLHEVDDIAKPLQMELLPEIHESYEKGTWKTIADQGFMTYDFFMPGLILDAIENKTGAHLKKWGQQVIDENIRTVNMLGCHDGIPMLDLKGLLAEEQIQNLIDTIVGRGGAIKNLHGQKNMYYQVNATFYSALGEDDAKMKMARALQLFMPGKPQIWYLDLLGGKNDHEAVKRAGADGHKEINRTNYTREMIDEAMKSDLVKEQLELLHLRNTHPAFDDNSKITIDETPNGLRIIWTNQEHQASLDANLQDMTYTIEATPAE